MVVGVDIVWWPSARSTVLKKSISGERDAVAAAADEAELPISVVIFGDAVLLFEGRVGDDPHPTPGAIGGL